MGNEQTNIFELIYPKYKITKPIRLIEFFAGYGSQALALKYLGVEFEHWKTCEWAIKSIQAYKDIHFTNDTKEISMSKDEMIDYLYNKGISSNYNEPMKLEQIKRLNEKQLKTIIENIEITHNLVNIQQVKGKDLEIKDNEHFTYLLTYSFPCVLAGTKIITNSGYKNIEDVKPGDMVLTHNNRYKKVLKTMKRISDHYYNLKGVGVNDLLLTGEHPLYVERNGSFQWIKVKDLTTNDYFTFNVNNHSTRGYKDYGYDLWLLGRYVADGYINDKLYNSVEFAIGRKKQQEFEKHISTNFKKSLSSENCFQYRIADRDFQNKCKEFGDGALNKRIPQWVIDLPLQQLQEFFDGYMSGDGHIRKRGNTTQAMFSTVSKELFLGLQQIVMKLYGCICSCYIRKDNRKRTFNDSYNCQFNIENIHRFQYKIGDKIVSKVTKIEKIKKDTIVYNLEVEEDNSYTCDNVIVHNCQDLSLAGKGKGMADTTTRSGMLWEVERILNELKETNSLPQILLMENVPQVHGTDNVEHFNKWQLALENMGYKSYFQDLIATDYGIPQTRNRCFMVSILGDYSYTFPKPIPLKLKLKDLLEDEVDEKYYLSDKQIKDIQSWNAYEKPLENMKKIENSNISPTLTTRSGAYAAGMILIKNATKKGYLEATDGDGINLSNRMEHQRGNVQKDKIQTLTTSGGNDRGVCVGTYQYAKSDKFMNGKDRLQLGKETSDTLQTTPKEGVVTIGNYSKSNHNASRIVDKNYSAPTVMENHGTITAIQSNDLRIRKLTPLECGRLMGVKDKDITNMLKNQSNSSAYHCFGDSIICMVLCAIFGELLNIDYKNLIESWNYNE